jgi:hypothetical protein
MITREQFEEKLNDYMHAVMNFAQGFERHTHTLENQEAVQKADDAIMAAFDEMRGVWTVQKEEGGYREPDTKGYYWATDGYLAVLAYYDPRDGWGIFEGPKCYKQDDMNFDILAYSPVICHLGALPEPPKEE